MSLFGDIKEGGLKSIFEYQDFIERLKEGNATLDILPGDKLKRVKEFLNKNCSLSYEKTNSRFERIQEGTKEIREQLETPLEKQAYDVALKLCLTSSNVSIQSAHYYPDPMPDEYLEYFRDPFQKAAKDGTFNGAEISMYGLQIPCPVIAEMPSGNKYIISDYGENTERFFKEFIELITKDKK